MPAPDQEPLSEEQALADNRRLWDVWTGIHVGSDSYDVASFRDGSRPIRLANYEHEFDAVPWPVAWLARSADGLYRLPGDVGGQLPLYFSLKASRP